MEKEIQVGQIRTRYIEKGEGTPFVILHGWDDTLDLYLKFQEVLANRAFRVFLLYIPGLSERKFPMEKSWSSEDYAKWLTELTDELKIEKFFLFGHSFGSIIATSFAALYPEKLFGLIISGPPKGGNDFNPIKLLAILGWVLSILHKIKKILPRNIYPWLEKQYGIYKRSNGRMFETLGKVFSANTDLYAKMIKTPTLIVYGEKDDSLIIRGAKKLARKIKNSCSRVFEGVSHNIQEVCPEELADEIEGFINDSEILS